MKYEVKKLTPFRLLSIYAYDAIKKGHNMFALIELDVTDIRQSLRVRRKEGHKASFFGFLLSAIAKAIEDCYTRFLKFHVINSKYHCLAK